MQVRSLLELTRNALWVLAVGLSSVAGCADDDEEEWATGPGSVGAACNYDSQCPGFCCTTRECGDGMCSYRCKDDRDCPAGTLCEGKVCYWTCSTERDCRVGQKCEHGHTVCQY
ncbi:hypothetical protein ACFL5O_02265 [Myxococcota bacterium]